MNYSIPFCKQKPCKSNKRWSFTILLLITLHLSITYSQTLDFPYFDSLPNEYGWTYLTNVDGGIHSISDSILIQNSIGNESAYGFYQLDYGTVLISEAYWSVNVRARVTEVEENNSGFFFNVVQNELLYSVRLTPTEIYLVDEYDGQYIILENDNTTIHDFTLKGVPNAGMLLLVDNIIRAEAFPVPISSLTYNIGYDLAFGDGSSRSNSNAHGEWLSYKFSQYTINPFITEIVDVPNDQGGWVKIEFTKSIYDTDSLILSKTSSPEMYTIEIDDGSSWTAAASTVAYGKSRYSVLVPTTRDSTLEANGLINFRVVAGMEEGNYVSNILPGYSLDNIPPAPPNNFNGTSTSDSKIKLSWSANNEKDFSSYNLFRSIDGQGFELLIKTVDTCYTDSNVKINLNYDYIIEAVDYSGNKSDLSRIVELKITDIGKINSIHEEYYLKQNYPNPFNPTTTIKFGIARQGNVQIVVYDILGNIVKELMNEDKSNGEYGIIWSGKNNYGQLVSSGIYYYRITTNEYNDVRKMLFLK